MLLKLGGGGGNSGKGRRKLFLAFGVPVVCNPFKCVNISCTYTRMSLINWHFLIFTLSGPSIAKSYIKRHINWCLAFKISIAKSCRSYKLYFLQFMPANSGISASEIKCLKTSCFDQLHKHTFDSKHVIVWCNVVIILDMVLTHYNFVIPCNLRLSQNRNKHKTKSLPFE